MSHLDVLANDAVRDLVMPIPVALYQSLVNAGAIDRKTELIDGVIIKKMTKSPLHAYIANELHRFCEAALPSGYILRKEDPLSLSNSEPEPDLALIKGQHRDFIRQHPSHAEWVIEVAVSSIALDRQKAAIYAAANIPEYWLVLPEQKKIEIYTQPIQGQYTMQHVATAEQRLTTRCGRLDLSALFYDGPFTMALGRL